MLKNLTELRVEFLSDNDKDELLKELWKVYEKHVISARVKQKQYHDSKKDDEEYSTQRRIRHAEAFRIRYATDPDFRDAIKERNALQYKKRRKAIIDDASTVST